MLLTARYGRAACASARRPARCNGLLLDSWVEAAFSPEVVSLPSAPATLVLELA